MKCSKAISKEVLWIIAGVVVLLTVLAVTVVIFEIRKSPDKDGRYIYAAVVNI